MGIYAISLKALSRHSVSSRHHKKRGLCGFISMCLRLFFVNTDSAFTACKDTELCQKVRTVNYEKHRRVLKKGLKKDLKNVLKNVFKNVFKNILKKIVAV